jgi:hypothetical protein
VIFSKKGNNRARLLPLGPGLVGLAAIRRRFKK